MATQRPLPETHPLRWNAETKKWEPSILEATYLATLVNQYGEYLDGFPVEHAKEEITLLAEEGDWLSISAISMALVEI